MYDGSIMLNSVMIVYKHWTKEPQREGHGKDLKCEGLQRSLDHIAVWVCLAK